MAITKRIQYNNKEKCISKDRKLSKTEFAWSFEIPS